ncbi:4-hydroxy-2-oxo-heptane-1,7-dioate aldolase [Corynebacterium occultum]|uniref:4-hydroxy-2-oxo-heptane-1,7-dioate aldolase n=1 Tax=Corynebacterium occultum TaxID=2675219 RepID=A0A6B8WBK6_9CORY|nr:HpcH/HpaI aldolase/citrate lyase family protein [Corynebacterium occultum]QGU08226.1 4-hydroxy-2-oxo-heptane-1,7-dioate aldolase [Corynebacterium occultum]
MTSLSRSLPPNRFKQRLLAGEQLHGLWTVLGDGYAAELLGGCGYDWLLIDAEHAPNDLRSVLQQLQGIAASREYLGEHANEVSQPVLRIPHGDPVLIKQYLEIGVRNLLVPMVESAEQAAGLVKAIHYPQDGARGVGATLGRASQWGRYQDYLAKASQNITLIVQIESRKSLENLAEIAATPGVDGVFFGPSDLAADFGLAGQPGHPEVTAAIDEALATALSLGVRCGIMMINPEAVREWYTKGISFAGVGVDTILLTRAADELLASFRD